MKKKVSDTQKKQIKELFLKGDSIHEIANSFEFSIQTITRQLKILIGEDEFKKLKKNISVEKKNKIISEKYIEQDDLDDQSKNIFEDNHEEIDNKNINFNEYSQEQTFFEILPVMDGVNLDKQKELSSVPISDIDFPKIVYMIVDKKIELEIKLLKDYPDWEFLPAEDLNRKTIEIYFDLKVAKRACNKEQRVIKVPNTDVFRITAPILLSRGISRIVSDDKLIAL